MPNTPPTAGGPGEGNVIALSTRRGLLRAANRRETADMSPEEIGRMATEHVDDLVTNEVVDILLDWIASEQTELAARRFVIAVEAWDGDVMVVTEPRCHLASIGLLEIARQKAVERVLPRED